MALHGSAAEGTNFVRSDLLSSDDIISLIFSDLSVTGQELSLVSRAGSFSGPALCLFILSLTLALTWQ